MSYKLYAIYAPTVQQFSSHVDKVIKDLGLEVDKRVRHKCLYICKDNTIVMYTPTYESILGYNNFEIITVGCEDDFNWDELQKMRFRERIFHNFGLIKEDFNDKNVKTEVEIDLDIILKIREKHDNWKQYINDLLRKVAFKEPMKPKLISKEQMEELPDDDE